MKYKTGKPENVKYKEYNLKYENLGQVCSKGSGPSKPIVTVGELARLRPGYDWLLN